MDALLIGPALALSFGLTLLLGKALLSVFMSVMENRGGERTTRAVPAAEPQNGREIAAA